MDGNLSVSLGSRSLITLLVNMILLVSTEKSFVLSTRTSKKSLYPSL